MSKQHPKLLLVEGREDKRIIPFLMEKNGVNWPDRPEQRPVQIEVFSPTGETSGEEGGLKQLTKAEDYLKTHLSAHDRQAVGILLDADEDASKRWVQVKAYCERECSGLQLPDDIDEGGIVVETSLGPRLGIWIMPDNQSPGMMETFLKCLVPERHTTLFEYAEKVCRAAKEKEAPFKDSHFDKAKIHTWLAWQDPPGRQLHDSIKQCLLSPDSPYASRFVSWFRRLFDV